MKNTHKIELIIFALSALFFISCRGKNFSELSTAIDGNDLTAIENIVAKNPRSVNQPDSRKDTRGMAPLHYAAWKGRLEIVKFLLDHGADLNATVRGQNVLHFAVRSKNIDVVAFLLEQGVDVNSKGFLESSPLMYAAAGNNLKMVQFLLDHGADIQQKDIRGLTALYDAVRNGSKELIKYLIDKGSNINEISNESWGNETPLYHAIAENRIDNAILLIQHNANVNIATSYGSTPLHLAVEKGQKEVIEMLLKNKSDPLARDKYGKKPVELLTETTPNRSEIEKLFAVYNPEGIKSKLADDKKITDEKLREKLINDIDSIDIKEAKIAVENGLDDTEKNHLLYVSFITERNDIALLLLEHGASANIMDEDQDIPLIVAAATQNKYDLMKMLLEHGANVNAVDKTGDTALHIAVLFEYKELEMLLCQYGADKSLKDNDSDTPADMNKPKIILGPVKYYQENK